MFTQRIVPVHRLRIITFAAVLVLVFGFLAMIHPFLAVSNPIEAEVLVVEGWLPCHHFLTARDVFFENGYRILITVGGPIPDKEGEVDSTWAERAASELRSVGVPDSLILIVSAVRDQRGKTYQSFLALHESGVLGQKEIDSVNVFTGGVHARKSWILCRKALGDEVAVGVISSAPKMYNPEIWLLSPRGFRLVFKNLAGTLLAFAAY